MFVCVLPFEMSSLRPSARVSYFGTSSGSSCAFVVFQFPASAVAEARSLKCRSPNSLHTMSGETFRQETHMHVYGSFNTVYLYVVSCVFLMVRMISMDRSASTHFHNSCV